MCLKMILSLTVVIQEPRLMVRDEGKVQEGKVRRLADCAKGDLSAKEVLATRA